MRAHAGTLVLRVRGCRMLAGYHRPQGPQRRRFPAVLFLRGFPGGEKSVDVQRALLSRGVAALAPSFLGAWGSGGEYRFTTLVAQARAAARLRVPRLLAHGDADDVIPVAVSRRLARLSASPVRLKIWPGAGHDFLDRRPELARLATSFLAGRLRAERRQRAPTEVRRLTKRAKTSREFR